MCGGRGRLLRAGGERVGAGRVGVDRVSSDRVNLGWVRIFVSKPSNVLAPPSRNGLKSARRPIVAKQKL